MPETRPLRVFLCHSSHDKPAVRELYRQLSTEGWMDVWLDEEKLYPGQDWNLEIEKAVEAADAILVCLSNNSITKEGYIQRELRIVLDYADYKPEGTLYLIPIRLEQCDPPRRLRAWQYADYFEKDRDRAYQRLLISLQMRAKSLGVSKENYSVSRISKSTRKSPKAVANQIDLPINTSQSLSWKSRVAKFHVGQLVEGVITRLTKFGAFARLEGDIEGLIHISEIAEHHIEHPKEVLMEGQVLALRVIRIDLDQQRIGLSIRKVDSALYADEDFRILKDNDLEA